MKKHLDNKLEIIWLCRDLQHVVSNPKILAIIDQILSESEDHRRSYGRMIEGLASEIGGEYSTI